MGAPLRSLNHALTNSTGPGVGERTIDAPFGRVWRLRAPERAEQVRVGLERAGLAVVEQADELREAERARHQHRLVVGLGGLLADADDVVERRAPLLLGKFHFAREVVQVADESAHDLLEAALRRTIEFGQHRLGHVLLGFDDHWASRWQGTGSPHPNRSSRRGPSDKLGHDGINITRRRCDKLAPNDTVRRKHP